MSSRKNDRENDRENDATIRPLYLNLLSAAIWNKPADTALFEGLNNKTWPGIVEMARSQSVSALIADKALSLPKECLPARGHCLQFIGLIKQTEEFYRYDSR